MQSKNTEQKVPKLTRSKVKAKVKMTEAHWRVIFEKVGIGMALVDLDGSILEANRSFQEMIGYAAHELRAKNWGEVTHPDDIAVEEARLKEFVEGKEIDLSLEKRYLRKDGDIVWASVNITLLRDSRGNPQFVLGVIQNITERKLAEERFQAIFEGSAIAMVLADLEGRIMESNPAAQEMLGYTREELHGMYFKEYTYPEDLPAEMSLWRELRDEIRDYLQIEKRFLRKDGSIVWGNLTGSLIRSKGSEHRFFLGMAQDITQRKLGEEQLLIYQKQLQTLASELSLAEDRERRQVATDIHDCVTQSLCLAEMKLMTLRECAPFGDYLQDLDDIRELINKSVQESRHLILGLSPPILYDLGFEAAVRWLVDRVRDQQDIPVILRNDQQPKPLDQDVAIVLFRSMGELIVNISKHAQAQNVAIAVLRDGDHIRLEVEDDGVGFDVSKLRNRDQTGGGFGLFSISERLKFLGGRLDIESKAGKGTRAIMVAPLKK